jgi:hypothetical protein
VQRWNWRESRGRRKIGGEMAAVEQMIVFPIRSPSKGGFNEEHVTTREVMLGFMGQWIDFP